MGIGNDAARGGLETVQPVSPATRTAPVSDRLCDAVVVAFALWSVCSHAVVAAGGGLVALLWLFTIAATAGVLLRVRRGGAVAPPEPIQPAGPSDSSRPPLRVLRLAALVCGVTAALVFAVRQDVVQLWWSAVILLGVAAVAVCLSDAPRLSPPERSRRSETLLWLMAAAGVVITLISHRPDADDAHFVDFAVSAADVPSRALLGEDTMHGIKGLPLHLPAYRAESYPLLNGAVSYLTGIPAIYCFHWLSAALAALLVPLAHAKLFRILTPRRWLAAVATLMFILLAAGETHRWYGNFSFVRMWQGKSIFLSVFLPLICAYALRFAVRRNLRDWIMLAAAQIAAVGATSSALWAAPAVATFALCSAAWPSRQGLKTVVLGALASTYVSGGALLIRVSLTRMSFGVRMPFGIVPSEQGPDPTTAVVHDALVTVLGDSRLLIFAIAILMTGWVFAPTALARRFAVVFPLAVLLALVNPYTAVWVAHNVTGPVYWRSLWALPLPIVMALVLTSPLSLGVSSSRPVARGALWLALLTAFALLVPRYGGLSKANRVRLSRPGLKVPHTAYRWAAEVNASVPPGSHVAVPSKIDIWIVTFHHHVYPLTVRHYLRPWPNILSYEEILDRNTLRGFLDAPERVDRSPQQFRDELDRYHPQAVCMASSPRAETARAILRQSGFHMTLARKGYELWLRSGADSRA
jgi:hypothetical protein